MYSNHPVFIATTLVATALKKDELVYTTKKEISIKLQRSNKFTYILSLSDRSYRGKPTTSLWTLATVQDPSRKLVG